MTSPSRFAILPAAVLLSAGFAMSALCTHAQSVFLDFDTAADYDNNFWETSGASSDPSKLSWDSGDYLKRTGATGSSVAIYNSQAAGGSNGSGGTAGVLPLDKFENFTVQADVSVSDYSTATAGLGFYTKLNDTATSGYLTVFRITGTSVTVELFENSSAATGGNNNVKIVADSPTNIIAGTFAKSTYYTFSLQVQDVGDNVSFTASIFEATTHTQIGSSVTFTDTINAVTGFGQVGIRLGNASTNHVVKMDNVSISAIPEPSTYALLGGVAALGLVLVRRHSRRRA